ncbi:tyrosine-type recombinase/integrase [Thiorhodovibrio frisius]|uniref:tyrosine-type recombinase/integrase n=1 Tax=Thiorhodovibrio frisius TaxID=631362 RepID=UPI002B260C90|nr:tyrosine-type recombinase/integrase [Thiorhodovibrio frisius]WPL20540.1 Putative prophage CPS-53 integrase [Thiorhodovibrio frisius]
MAKDSNKTERRKLIKRDIDAARHEAGDPNARVVLWDSELLGFGCRVFPSGAKTFVLSYRTNGRKRLLTIGRYGTLTVEQARKMARAELVKAEAGTDPLEERQRDTRGETIKDLCAAYLERHASQKKSGHDDQRRINSHILPTWRNLKAASIKRADVAALHSKIGKRAPYEANRTLALVAKMFELARRWGFVPEAHINPARDIDRFKETKRDRYIKPDELPHLAAAINSEPNESARNGLWLYLLTGARKSELLKARWDDLDLDRGELRLADTKAGRTHYLPLSAPALALLREIPRQPGNPYILPGKGPRAAKAGEKTAAPLVNISKPWTRVKKAATLARWRELPQVAELIDRLTEARAANKSKHTACDWDATPSLTEIRAACDTAGLTLPPAIDDVRLHDLRRTVGSWLAQAGNSLHLIGRVLNHSNASTTQVYARFGQDNVRAALEQHGERLLGAAGLKPKAPVVDLPTKHRKAG